MNNLAYHSLDLSPDPSSDLDDTCPIQVHLNRRAKVRKKAQHLATLICIKQWPKILRIRKARATELMKLFLVDHQRQVLVLVARKFVRKVRAIQSYWRSFAEVTRCRCSSLEIKWVQVETERIAERKLMAGIPNINLDESSPFQRSLNLREQKEKNFHRSVLAEITRRHVPPKLRRACIRKGLFHARREYKKKSSSNTDNYVVVERSRGVTTEDVQELLDGRALFVTSKILRHVSVDIGSSKGKRRKTRYR